MNIESFWGNAKYFPRNQKKQKLYRCLISRLEPDSTKNVEPIMNRPHIREIDNTRIEITFFIFFTFFVTANFGINNILTKISVYFLTT